MKERELKNDLTYGFVWKRLLSFFLPVVLGTIVQQLYNTADALIVGRYVGTQALAAVGGSTAQIVNLTIGFFVALCSGASVVVAQLFGEKDYAGVNRAANTALLGSAVIGAAITVLGMIFAPQLLKLMRTPQDTIEDAVVYLRVLFAGTIFMILYNMCAGILRAVGDSKRPFYYLLACCLLNVALDYIFVAKFLWSVYGAALATVLSQLLSFVLIIVHMLTTKDSYRLKFSLLRLDRLIVKKMLYIGVPSGLEHMMFSISNSIVQIGINTLGTATVAAWSLAGKIDGIYFAVVSAMGIAVMSFSGQNYGAGRIDRVKECVKSGMIMTTGATIAMSAIILYVGPMLVPYFGKNAEVMELTKYIFWQLVPYYFLWSPVEIYSGALRGVSDAVVPVVILGICIAAFRILWVVTVFSVFHKLGVLCRCYPISWFLAAVPLAVRYYRGKWNKQAKT